MLSYTTEMSGQAACCVKSDGVERKLMMGRGEQRAQLCENSLHP